MEIAKYYTIDITPYNGSANGLVEFRCNNLLEVKCILSQISQGRILHISIYQTLIELDGSSGSLSITSTRITDW